jgi:hypothetical protein
MFEFITSNPWIYYPLLFIILFFVVAAIQLYLADRRMPREQKRDAIIRRAAMALRKLSRAKRVLNRFIAVRAVSGKAVSVGMVHRLWKANNDAEDAAGHLSFVLKKSADWGCPIKVIQNVDRYAKIANTVREECKREAKKSSATTVDITVLSQKVVSSLINDCSVMLNEAKSALNDWIQDTEKGEKKLKGTVDSVIFASRGTLRNPMKPKNAIEDSQSLSVLTLNETKIDIRRTQDCIFMIEQVINIFGDTPQLGNYDPSVVKIVSDALDAIDRALGDADLPLPSTLVTNENPFEEPSCEEPIGVLQKIYRKLVMLEVYLVSNKL